jgi:hypothetical protein
MLGFDTNYSAFSATSGSMNVARLPPANKCPAMPTACAARRSLSLSPIRKLRDCGPDGTEIVARPDGDPALVPVHEAQNAET